MPRVFIHYMHPELGAVCIDEFCSHANEADPHAHSEEEQYYGPRAR